MILIYIQSFSIGDKCKCFAEIQMFATIQLCHYWAELLYEILSYYLLNHLFFNSSNIFVPNPIHVCLLSQVMNGIEINKAQNVSFNYEEVTAAFHYLSL